MLSADASVPRRVVLVRPVRSIAAGRGLHVDLHTVVVVVGAAEILVHIHAGRATFPIFDAHGTWIGKKSARPLTAAREEDEGPAQKRSKTPHGIGHIGPSFPSGCYVPCRLPSR